MEKLELKLTTKRALEYEQRTGKDLLLFLKDISDSGMITIKETVDLFLALGDNYTVEMFDEWDLPYLEKVEAVLLAVKEYSEGKK